MPSRAAASTRLAVICPYANLYSCSAGDNGVMLRRSSVSAGFEIGEDLLQQVVRRGLVKDLFR